MVKTLIAGLFGAGAVVTTDICKGCEPAQTSVTSQQLTAAQTTVKTDTLRVEGMTCGGCEIGVRTVLKRLPGVSKAEVSYEETRAIVIYDPSRVTIAQMVAAIKTLGYKATVVGS